jgi:hypothetical protein
MSLKLKFATAVVLAVAATTGQAFACMGPTVIYSDNFQQANPAWAGPPNTLVISGGVAQLTPPQGDWTITGYTGAAIDTGDMCADMVSPTVPDQSQAVGGLVFGLDASSSSIDYYSLQIEEDGYVTVARWQNSAWANPLPWKAAPMVKTGPNATNNLRVTWKGTTGTAYINGQSVGTFTMQPVQNTLIGFFGQGDASPTAGATWKFSNLKVTNAP